MYFCSRLGMLIIVNSLLVYTDSTYFFLFIRDGIRRFLIQNVKNVRKNSIRFQAEMFTYFNNVSKYFISYDDCYWNQVKQKLLNCMQFHLIFKTSHIVCVWDYYSVIALCARYQIANFERHDCMLSTKWTQQKYAQAAHKSHSIFQIFA